MLNDLKKLIAVPSVMGKPAADAPFGTGPRQALDTFLAIAANYGMRTHCEKGYCGWAEIGQGDGLIGILGHLDVVPAGDGWSHDPFTLVCENGMLYGRGVADDKGPTVAALHALKHIAESGEKCNHRIRLIVGCNEENGSECIEYYRAHCEIPQASFVPDADFPLINSEKGILHLLLQLPVDQVWQQNISAFTAGDRPNVVPDACVARIPKGSALYNIFALYGRDNSLFYKPQIAATIADAGLRIEDFSAHYFENELVLESRGVAGHAMAPEKGENAAVKLLRLLDGVYGDASPALRNVRRYLGEYNAANSLGITAKDDVSGELTVNLGVVSYKNNTLSLTLDCRLPVCADHEKVQQDIARLFPDGKLTVLRWSPNLYIPESDKLVQALLEAYGETTGGEKKCLYCGGGTYARELPNAVAFGPTFPDLETNIHNIDECFPIELFDKLPAIYEAAIRKLDKAF